MRLRLNIRLRRIITCKLLITTTTAITTRPRSTLLRLKNTANMPTSTPRRRMVTRTNSGAGQRRKSKKASGFVREPFFHWCIIQEKDVRNEFSNWFLASSSKMIASNGPEKYFRTVADRTLRLLFEARLKTARVTTGVSDLLKDLHNSRQDPSQIRRRNR